jgi:hypothetical protein
MLQLNSPILIDAYKVKHIQTYGSYQFQSIVKKLV